MTSHPSSLKSSSLESSSSSPIANSPAAQLLTCLNFTSQRPVYQAVGKVAIAAAIVGNSLSGGAQAQTTYQSVHQERIQQSTQTTAQTTTQTTAQVEPTTAEETAQPGTITPPADPTPKPTPFAPRLSGIIDLSTQAGEESVGVGHLRPQTTEEEGDAVSWLENVILPLYVSPGGDHWGWIYQGWLVPEGQTYLAIGRDAGFAMVKSDENLYTFPVLDIRDDGWFQVQYTTGGSAWAHTSQLALGETAMVLEDWEETLLEQSSVYFLNSSEAQPLRSQPEAANNMLSLVSADSLIEPLDFAGDWMRVRVTRPTANCSPLTGATVTEGWMRWRSEARKSLVWYQSDSRC